MGVLCGCGFPGLLRCGLRNIAFLRFRFGLVYSVFGLFDLRFWRCGLIALRVVGFIWRFLVFRLGRLALVWLGIFGGFGFVLWFADFALMFRLVGWLV